MVKPYGVGALFVAQALAFNTKAFPGGAHPRNWSEAWDVSKFPGPRTITAMDYGFRPLEILLLADGVPADKLYPLDTDRAFKSLERLRPSVAKWVQRGMDPGELLARGEVVVANASTGRVLAMRQQGAPIDMVFDQALLYPDYWVVPKGAKNRDAAMKLAQFATSAQAQAGFSGTYPNGPVNRGAFKLLTDEQAARLPTAPATIDRVVIVNGGWWETLGSDGKFNTELVSERWRKWNV